MARKLFVGGLPWAVDDERLLEVFSEYGQVAEAVVIKDRETNRSKGFGFVTFDNEQDAEEALELDGGKIDHRQVRVNYAEERRDRRDNKHSSDRRPSRNDFNDNSSRGQRNRRRDRRRRREEERDTW